MSNNPDHVLKVESYRFQGNHHFYWSTYAENTCVNTQECCLWFEGLKPQSNSLCTEIYKLQASISVSTATHAF